MGRIPYIENFNFNYAIPDVYDESLSYAESVAKLKGMINRLIDVINDSLNKDIKNDEDIKKINLEIKKIKQDIGNYISNFYIKNGSITIDKLSEDFFKQIYKIIHDEMYNLHHFITFGLDDNGHFYSLIPDNWRDIEFSTDNDGRLVLEFN